jgi:hypothetical protein
MNARAVISVSLVVLSAIAPLVSPASAGQSVQHEIPTEIQENDVLNGTFGTNYTVGFDKEDRVVSVTARNGNNDVRKAGIAIEVDGRSFAARKVNLSPGETASFRINITDGLNSVTHNHTVAVSTYGDYVQYNFTEEFDPDETDELPVPRITDVKVENGTIRGEPSTVAMVTVRNPSVQTYGMKLMVFTEGTDGSLYPSSVKPQSNRTLKVELLDPRGELVAGEVRLYSGNLSAGDGGIDQVEFVGRAGEETNHWNRSYEPVKGTWRKDNYIYENESVPDSDADSLVEGVDVRLVGAGVATAVLALLAALLFVRRR